MNHGQQKKEMNQSMKQKKYIFLFLSTVGVILSSCSSNGQNSNAKKDASTLVVEVEQNKSSLKINETVQLSCHVYGSIRDEVEFLSLNEEILSVDENGLVKALKEGNGKIQVSAKEDASTKKILSFEVYATLEDQFESVKMMMDDLRSYDYTKGVVYPCKINIDLGKVKGSLSGSNEMELFDTSRNSTYSTLKLPLELTIADKNDEGDFIKTRADVNTFFNDLFSRNVLLSAANKTLKLKENILLSLLEKIDGSYLDYLSLNDFSSLTDICFYASGQSDFYTSLDMNFSNDEADSLHPFAFQDFDMASLLLSLYNRFSSSFSSENENFDFSSYLTEDGLLKLQSMLSSYLVEEKTEDGYSLRVNETILKFINSYYKEKITNYTYHIASSSFDVSFQLPTSITKIYLNMEIDDSSHPLSNLSFVIEGTREDKDETYDVLSLSLNRDDIKNDGSAAIAYSEFENLKKAKQDFSFDGEKSSIVQLIKESDVLYQAEKTYGANTDNKNLQTKKSALLSFYFDDFHDEEFTRLLYPMYRRLKSLDYTYQDEVFAFLSSETIKDDEVVLSQAMHLANGEKKEDFTYSLKAAEEEMFSIVDETKIKAVKAIYDGGVNDKNEKTYSTKSQIEFLIQPKDSTSTLKEQTKTVTLEYTGSKVGFSSSDISFKENENFDESTREYQVEENTTIDLKDILSLSSNEYLALATSSETSLAKTKLLSPGKVEVLSITQKNGYTRDLVSIQFTIASLSSKSIKTGFVYLRIKKAS